MPWETAAPVLVWFVICLAISAVMWIFRPHNKLANILLLLDYFAANLFFFMAINWAAVNYWLHFLPIVFTIVLTMRFLRKERQSRFLPSSQGWILAFVFLLTLPMFVFFDVRLFASLKHVDQQGQTAYMAFPLRNGLYATLNGGNGIAGIGLNSYYQDWLGRKTGNGQGEEYALDAAKISLGGSLTVSGAILPHDHTDYIGFQDYVYSPCNGTVVKVTKTLPDIQPFTSSPSAGMGNLIVIRCVDMYVTLSNLRDNSIAFNEGDLVSYQNLVATVGNSANNTFPHLHIQVNKGSPDGPAVPMLFEHLFSLNYVSVNRFIVRNLLTNR